MAKAEEAAQQPCKKAKKKKRDYTRDITECMNREGWQEALELLKEMRQGKVIPPLGAIQRWVRLSDLSGNESLSASLLDSIMRSCARQTTDVRQTAPIQHPSIMRSGSGTVASSSGATVIGSISRHSAWAPPDMMTPEASSLTAKEIEETAQAAIERSRGRFQVITAEGQAAAASSSTPSPIFLVDPSVLQLDTQQAKTINKVPVPFVANAFVLTNVLSKKECAQLVAVSESLGFHHDVDYSFIGAVESNKSAARTSAGGDRAAGLVWLIDPMVDRLIFDRVRAHLPQEVGGGGDPVGGRLAGINARWRVYRYDQGCVYRPHIDGAWPGSGLSPDGSRCVYDAFGDRWSHFTFLIYLNEDFEGGSTVFYTPGSSEGVLEARGVSPRVGNVLIFPHGESSESLIHEGSAVTQGTKYVIRSDVLYYKKGGKKDTVLPIV